MCRPQNDPKGFTLVELMVAMMIFSGIMLMLFSSFDRFVSSGHAIAGKLKENEKATIALERISTDLKHLYVLPGAMYQTLDEAKASDPFALSGEVERVGSKAFSKIRFSSLELIETGQTPEQIPAISYYVKKNRTSGFDLMRSEAEPDEAGETRPCTDPVLAGGISRFYVAYTDPDQNDFDHWSSDDDAVSKQMPRRVSIVLGFKDNGRETLFRTAVALPVNRGTID